MPTQHSPYSPHKNKMKQTYHKLHAYTHVHMYTHTHVHTYTTHTHMHFKPLARTGYAR